MDINSGYKFVAIVSLCYATFSCSSSVYSNTDPEVLAKLDALQSSIDVLVASVDTLQATVGPAPTAQRACTVGEIVAGSTTDANGVPVCDESLLPDGVSTSTTYCIDQGRAGELGASFKIEPGIEVEIGGGWPNAIWGKLTGKAIIPPVVALGPVPVPLPNEIHAGGAVSLGRGFSICVDIPITDLDDAMTAQVHDLVRGVNDGGKYARRTGRLLDYAAVRTPGATPFFASSNVARGKPAFQDADDSFDVADAAMERLIDGEFAQAENGLMLFRDPVFRDLIASLEVPLPALDTINDPDRILSVFSTIGQSNIANTCQTMGITDASRARFPALANQCARFGIYPNINLSLDAANLVAETRANLNSLRSWMCDNISLGLFTGC